MKRAFLTLTLDYSADPDDYGTDDHSKMSEIDTENLMADPYLITELMENHGFKITVEIRDED